MGIHRDEIAPPSARGAIPQVQGPSSRIWVPFSDSGSVLQRRTESNRELRGFLKSCAESPAPSGPPWGFAPDPILKKQKRSRQISRFSAFLFLKLFIISKFRIDWR